VKPDRVTTSIHHPIPNQGIQGSFPDLGMDPGLRAASGGPKPIPNYCEIWLILEIGYAPWIVTRWSAGDALERAKRVPSP